MTTKKKENEKPPVETPAEPVAETSAPETVAVNKDEPREYTVTDKAGNFVAGKRSPGKGKSIKLTPRQAEHALRNGELEDPNKQKASKAD